MLDVFSYLAIMTAQIDLSHAPAPAAVESPVVNTRKGRHGRKNQITREAAEIAADDSRFSSKKQRDERAAKQGKFNQSIMERCLFPPNAPRTQWCQAQVVVCLEA